MKLLAQQLYTRWVVTHVIWFLSLNHIHTTLALASPQSPVGNGQGLVLAQVIHRHGYRTPIYKFPTDANADHDYGVKGDGQLTERGKELGFQLGQYLRSRYDGFLSTKYSIEEIYVQASDYDRTMMTVQSCLSGLFPPSDRREATYNWQPVIPVHSLTSTCDHLINPYSNCAKLKRLYTESLNLPFYQRLNRENAAFYRFLSVKSGLNVTNFVKVYEIWETLRVQNENGLPLPSWATSKNTFTKKMSKFGRIHFLKYTRTDEMKRLYSGTLLNELIQNMKVLVGLEGRTAAEQRVHKGAKGVHNAKMYIYSGHDTTISPLMDLLGIYDATNPPSYVAALMIELYHHHMTGETPGKDFVVKVFYRRKLDGGIDAVGNENVIDELEIPKCKKPCTLRKLEASFKEFLLNPERREEECKK